LLRPVGDDVSNSFDTGIVVEKSEEVLDELVSSEFGHQRRVSLDELVESVDRGDLEGTTSRREMSSEGRDEFGDVDLTGSEHEELLMALDGLDRDPFVLLQRELVDEDKDQRPNGSCFLKLRSKHSDDGADDPADDLVGGKISSNVDASDRSSFRFVSIGKVDAGELTESGGDEGRVGETGCCDDLSERGHGPEVDDGMRIVGEGDEDVDHRFEEGTTDKTSDVGVDGSEG